MAEVELLAERLDPASGAREGLTEGTRQLRACKRHMVDGHADAASTLLDMIRHAQRLVDLDPEGRDPFWSLRDVISDIQHGIADVLDRVADPLFGSDRVLEDYLASLASGEVAELRDAFAGHSPLNRRRLFAALVYRLERSRDPTGVAIWFRMPRPELGNQTPAAVLEGEAEDAARLLLPLAGGNRCDVAEFG